MLILLWKPGFYYHELIEDVLEKERSKNVQSKSPKKNVDREKASKKIEKPKEKIISEYSKEFIPLKSRVFKRLRSLSHKS